MMTAAVDNNPKRERNKFASPSINRKRIPSTRMDKNIDALMELTIRSAEMSK